LKLPNYNKTILQNTRKFISLCLEPTDSRQVCIHNRIVVLFDTVLYKSWCIFRKFFLTKKMGKHYTELKKWYYTYNSSKTPCYIIL